MNRQNTILNELRSLDSNLPFNNNPAFSVPEGYFDGLASSVLAKVKSSELSAEAELGEISPLLAGIPKVTPYSVPSLYFEQLSNHIPADADEELGVLAAIGKELPYTVPHRYFDGLPSAILSNVAVPKAKVVPLFARTWMRAASAAVIGGALFVAGYQYFDKKPDSPLAKQPVDVPQKTIAKKTPPVEQEIKNMATKELEEFIETVRGGEEATNQVTTSKKNEVKELLKDVSDKEIESFLADVASDEDELFVTD